MKNLLVQHGRIWKWLKRVKNRLELYRSKKRGTFAQHGEDKYILSQLGKEGFYIDVGANDPHRISNTYALYLSGWRGITIEPIRSLINDHRRMRPRDFQVNAGVGSDDGEEMAFYELSPHVLSTFDRQTAQSYLEEGLAVLIAKYDVPIRSLSSILKEHKVDKVDVMTIDVEGLELRVLEGMDFSKHAPRMIVIETLSAIGENSDADRVRSLLRENRYIKDCQLGTNEIYVRRSTEQ